VTATIHLAADKHLSECSSSCRNEWSKVDNLYCKKWEL